MQMSQLDIKCFHVAADIFPQQLISHLQWNVQIALYGLHYNLRVVCSSVNITMQYIVQNTVWKAV